MILDQRKPEYNLVSKKMQCNLVWGKQICLQVPTCIGICGAVFQTIHQLPNALRHT